MHGLVYYRNTLYLQYSLYSWIKTDGQEVMYLDCILQNPQETAFPRLGFDFIPLAYFEVCYKTNALWDLLLTLQGSYLETVLTL